jgi:hypothetical protein
MVDRDVIENVSVDNKQIAPAVIVKIEKARSECAIAEIRLSYPLRDRVVGKGSIAIVAV